MFYFSFTVITCFFHIFLFSLFFLFSSFPFFVFFLFSFFPFLPPPQSAARGESPPLPPSVRHCLCRRPCITPSERITLRDTTPPAGIMLMENTMPSKVVKPTYRLHIGARVNAALLTYLPTRKLKPIVSSVGLAIPNVNVLWGHSRPHAQRRVKCGSDLPYFSSLSSIVRDFKYLISIVRRNFFFKRTEQHITYIKSIVKTNRHSFEILAIFNI